MNIQCKIEDKPTPLCLLMEKYGSDKGHVEYQENKYHNYTLYYYSLFSQKRYEHLRIFELGIGTTNKEILCNMGVYGVPGASLRVWKEFFPKAQIFAADIDKTILFTEDRIKTYYCDQESRESIIDMWNDNIDLWEG
jgi:hypothetical protein